MEIRKEKNGKQSQKNFEQIMVQNTCLAIWETQETPINKYKDKYKEDNYKEDKF